MLDLFLNKPVGQHLYAVVFHTDDKLRFNNVATLLNLNLSSRVSQLARKYIFESCTILYIAQGSRERRRQIYNVGSIQKKGILHELITYRPRPLIN